MKKWIGFTAAAVLTVGILAGCSSGGKTDEMKSDVTTTSPGGSQSPSKAGDAPTATTPSTSTPSAGAKDPAAPSVKSGDSSSKSGSSEKAGTSSGSSDKTGTAPSSGSDSPKAGASGDSGSTKTPAPSTTPKN